MVSHELATNANAQMEAAMKATHDKTASRPRITAGTIVYVHSPDLSSNGVGRQKFACMYRGPFVVAFTKEHTAKLKDLTTGNFAPGMIAFSRLKVVKQRSGSS